MNSNSEIFEFMLANLQKVIVPKEFIALNLSLSQFELLALTLADKPEPVTMGRLAQGMSVPMSTATGIVDRLVRKNLVQRDRSEDDRRVVTVSLTPGGRDIVGQFKQQCCDFFDRIRNVLTEEEFETGLLLWSKVVIGMQEGNI